LQTPGKQTQTNPIFTKSPEKLARLMRKLAQMIEKLAHLIEKLAHLSR